MLYCLQWKVLAYLIKTEDGQAGLSALKPAGHKLFADNRNPPHRLPFASVLNAIIYCLKSKALSDDRAENMVLN